MDSVKQIINELEKLRNVKDLLNDDDKNDLIENFYRDFGNLPKDDPIRLNIAILLSNIGVIIPRDLNHDFEKFQLEDKLE